MNEDNFILEDVDRELTLDEKIKKITSEFEPKAVEYNSSDDGWSVKIQDQKSGMEFWVDVWVDTNYKDVEAEWNQYIFDIQDDDDQLRSAIQNDNNVWDLASSEAINYLQENNEIRQTATGGWEVVYKTPEGEFYEIYDEKFNEETGDIDGAGRIWNEKLGTEQEFVFTFDIDSGFIYFNDFANGNELDIRNNDLINEISNLIDTHKEEIDNYKSVNESKKIEEDKQEEYKYNGYTFIPMGNMKSNLNSFDMIKTNSKLNKVFSKEAGTYNYDEFYKIMPMVDIFRIPELDDILVMPGSNYLFEYSGNENTVTPINELQSEEELRKPDEQGLIGTLEDKEIVEDLLDYDKDYSDIASKYGYSFNDYQLYNIATLYITPSTGSIVKQKIEDVLEDINYHSECAEIIEDAEKFKASLFESKKVEAKTLTWDEIFKNAEGTTFGQKALKVKDQARAEVEELMQKDGIDVDNLESVEDAIDEYVSKHNIKFLDNGCIANKKTEDVAINNGFDVTKYPEVQSLADDIANSLKNKKKVTLIDVIMAIENWDGGDTSVFSIIERVDKDLYAKLDDHNTENEDNRYEAENQFLGLVEDTLDDMGITVYDEDNFDEYDENKKVESIKIDDKNNIKNRNYFDIVFQLDKLRLFEVDYILKGVYSGYDSTTPVETFDALGMNTLTLQKGKKDYQSSGYESEVLANYQKARDFYNKWEDKLLFHRLNDNEYNELLQDIEVLKDTYNYIEKQIDELDEYGFSLPETVELSKMKPKNKVGEAKTENIEKNTYNKTNADEINETIKDKEFMNNLGITAEDVIKQVEISKKDFDELVNYVNNYRGTFGELYKELQGWNLGYDDVEKDDDNLFDCYYKSLLVTINVDDGKLSVSPIDVYIYPNDITNVDSDELFHLDFDKPIEFDKILKEDATQCGAVDGGRVSIFGEKEKKEEDNKELSKVEKLKLMDDAARSINDEEIIDLWLMCGVPDGASELDFEEIAEDEESYREIEAEFKKVMKLAVEDGLYQCPLQAFEFAKTYEPNLENID